MIRWLLLVASLLLAPRAAHAQCAPVTPVPCPDCFAVFVMPDVQHYTQDSTQPAGASHLDLVTRYICNQRSAWTEPTTGKTMPIAIVVQLGDLVEHEPELQEWQRVSAAFDNLEACTPNVPNLVTNGNHDLKSFNYERSGENYATWFGPDRWTSRGYGCNAIDDCDSAAGQYFIGGGDPIPANSRNHSGEGGPGPVALEVGRHRAGLIRAPNGQPFLFLGLEQAFDFPPPLTGFAGIEGDDSAWPRQVLTANLGVPTLVFHHSMLWTFGPGDDRVRWGPETWHSDSISDPVGDYENDPDNFALSGGMEDLYRLLIEPYPQVRFLFTGHVYRPFHQADYTIARNGAGPPLWAFLRNFQRVDLGQTGDADRYGVGWNVIAVFDPDTSQVRVRSYRIDDVESYAQPPVNLDHQGNPAATECFETDQGGVGERILPWNFKAGGAPAPSLSSPGLAALAATLLGTTLWVMRKRSP